MGRILYINDQGVDIQPGWSIGDKINSRTTLSFTFESSEVQPIQEGQSILFLTGMTDGSLTRHEETEASYYGTWSSSSSGSYSGGSVKYTSTAGRYTTFNFIGTGIRILFRKSSGSGLANITLDDNAPIQINCYNATTMYKVVLFDAQNLAPGTHTIRIDVLGQKDPLSSGTTIYFDAFDVTNEFTSENKLFSGLVYGFTDREVAPGVLEYKVSGTDNCAIADRRVIAETIINQTAGWIITNKILPILAEEGITAGDIEDGPVISKANFAYVTCTEALDYLKGVTGLNWNIDFDKKLQFFSREKNSAPYVLNDSIRHSDFKRSKKIGKYRNTQYIRAGKGETTTQENESPTPAPDGQSRSFVTRFPLAARPVIEVNINGSGWVAINPDDIGVKGLDQAKRWYFQYDSNVISQDDSEAVLRDAENGTRTADKLRITYTGLFPILALVNRPEEITKRKAIEQGTSGIYEYLEKETSINTVEQAIEYGNGQIDTYGNIPDVVDFDTEENGLRAGQLLIINKPLFDIKESFLIESVSIKRYDADSETYSVKCLDGSSIGGWETFFKKLVKGNRSLVIGENEAVILLNSQYEAEKQSGLIYINPTITGLLPSLNLYPASTLYPDEIIVAEEIIYD